MQSKVDKEKSITPAEFHLILIDIAFAAAAQACGVQADEPGPATAYVPGSIRSRWLARNAPPDVQQRVTALATASSASLSQITAEQLLTLAARYSVPVAPETAERIATYFLSKREGLITYNR
jgi:hypothetical protein